METFKVVLKILRPTESLLQTISEKNCEMIYESYLNNQKKLNSLNLKNWMSNSTCYTTNQRMIFIIPFLFIIIIQVVMLIVDVIKIN